MFADDNWAFKMSLWGLRSCGNMFHHFPFLKDQVQISSGEGFTMWPRFLFSFSFILIFHVNQTGILDRLNIFVFHLYYFVYLTFLAWISLSFLWDLHPSSSSFTESLLSTRHYAWWFFMWIYQMNLWNNALF